MELIMSLASYRDVMLPAIETELQRVISDLDHIHTKPFHEMLTYHMGWTGDGAGTDAAGKRLRPILLLLTHAAIRVKEWENALPAAVAIELIHNFSLVHDDIQDNSDTRRGRLTIWKKWGMPQAINVGDALFICAQKAILGLNNYFSSDLVKQAQTVFQNACMSICTGQFLDISFEQRMDLSVEDYWVMITGKTAALLAACTEIGALLAGAEKATQEIYRNYGHYLGLAFQVQDDFLGIWGDSALTGKSTSSDLVAGKKSYPILLAIQKQGKFADRWSAGKISQEEAPLLAEQLSKEGIKQLTVETVDKMTELALESLRLASPRGDGGDELVSLTHTLLQRKS
jgi:geranylgeranyl diphosphate synthase, type I